MGLMLYLFLVLILHEAQLVASLTCPISDANVHICVCTQGVINCGGQSHLTVPSFTSGGSFQRLNLTLNLLTRIDNNVFASLNVSEIDLSWNNISSIGITAFAGVSSALQKLNLAHNKLTTLPLAIGELNHLKELDVTWNPIPGYKPGGGHGHSGTDGLDDLVMRKLGGTITSFKFGDPSMTTWPQSLDHLNQLKQLTVAGVNVPYWPAQCFHGFEQTLNSLTIEYASLEAVPLGITSLMHLESLHLDHFNIPRPDGTPSRFGDDSLTAAPFFSLANTLKELSLDYDGLTTFPDSIKDLTKLERLSLDGNDLQFVSDEAITLLKNANVSYLSLKNCNLKRVPGAISDLRNLVSLDLSQNQIRSIESTDLQNLYNLNSLLLDGNPLKYVSDNSLCGLDKLQDVSMINTSLKEISVAFKNLRKLVHLQLSLSAIDCTCDITWIKAWREKCQSEQKVEIQGKCETIDQDIMEYVNSRLPNCPGYTETYKDFVCGNSCAG